MNRFLPDLIQSANKRIDISFTTLVLSEDLGKTEMIILCTIRIVPIGKDIFTFGVI
ncbi:MAG: hypothetical protein SVM80_13055 [Halobacteriota archaeon]|nr:hypothetical protein [Halobacteriota archaeon]